MASEVQVSSFNRPQVGVASINQGIQELRDKLYLRLAEKGHGVFASRHEILGVIEEEMTELKEIVRDNSSDGQQKYKEELLDVAVAALFGYISMESVEW